MTESDNQLYVEIIAKIICEWMGHDEEDWDYYADLAKEILGTAPCVGYSQGYKNGVEDEAKRHAEGLVYD